MKEGYCGLPGAVEIGFRVGEGMKEALRLSLITLLGKEML